MFNNSDYEPTGSDSENESDDEMDYAAGAWGWQYDDLDDDHTDDYDRYEDYVIETGNDYLGMYGRESLFKRILWAFVRVKRAINHKWRMLTDAKYRQQDGIEIPF